MPRKTAARVTVDEKSDMGLEQDARIAAVTLSRVRPDGPRPGKEAACSAPGFALPTASTTD